MDHGGTTVSIHRPGPLARTGGGATAARVQRFLIRRFIAASFEKSR
jgi:hypothetical protein